MASRQTVAYIVLVIPFLYIYGLSLLSLLLAGQESSITPTMLLVSLALNLLVLGGVSFLYIYLKYDRGWRQVLFTLFYRRNNAGESLVVGAGVGLVLVIISGLIALGFQALGFDMDNPLAESILDNLNIVLVFAIPVLAAVSEETFFRGMLQMELARWQGQPLAIVVTSILFGLAHLSYGNPLQIFIPFLMGLVLAVLMMKYNNVVTPIAAHFTFNFIQLAAAYALW